ncbi:S53 family peptidase [Catenulispora pinisilvae]|uniref:S53 family peptidase n=1 Tax=Catenulispora pinisilvae TaxID=2705253 RepID=UPI0018918DF3|nr:S53 family peptidase [Catenulispora pinisilvae]
MQFDQRRWASAVLACACTATLTISGAGTATAAQSRVTLTGTGYQSDYGLTDLGPSDPGIAVTDNLFLNVRDPALVAAEARAVSTPGSPDYGHYLTAAQTQTLDQLTPGQLGIVEDWLKAAGLTVSEPNWRTLRVTGTIGQLEKAFDVAFHNYADPDPQDPYHWQIPTTDLSVPAGVSPLIFSPSDSQFSVPIAGQSGTEHSANGASGQKTGTGVNRPARLGGASYPNTVAPGASSGGSPGASSDDSCGAYWGQKQFTDLPPVNGKAPDEPPCGYTPDQLRHVYGLDKADLTGKGQNVAVITPAIDTLQQDVDTWAKKVGTQPLRPGQLTVVPTPDGSPAPTRATDAGGMIENTLDVEAVHGMAPDANIFSVGTSEADYGSILDSLVYTLDHTPATIVSLSVAFETTPDLQRAYNAVYEEGAVQGVGFYYASGDGGHDPATGSYLNPQAGAEFVTGVGGTSLGVGADNSREWETGWGDSADQLSADGKAWQPIDGGIGGGAGGGWMAGQPQPWYQRGVVSDQEATGPDGKRDRVGPDVAMDADGRTGLLIGGTAVNAITEPDPSKWVYTERRTGGTSLSTPLFAGVQALAQQARGGKAIGFANPLLYQLSGAGAFRDVTTLTGPAPATAVYTQVGPTTWNWILYQVLGTMPVTPPSMQTPATGPGFDTTTGLGTPTGRYLSLMRKH